jgi:hypothetical protein
MSGGAALPLPGPIMPRKSVEGVRRLLQLPHMRQNFSNCGCREPYFCGFRVPEPVAHFSFAKSPLPADFDGRDVLVLRPKTNGSGRDAEPFRNGIRGHKWFVVC